MGGNGSKSSGITDKEENQDWKTIITLDNGVKILQLKKSNASVKLPEESHSPNSIYAIFNKDGKSLKSIAKYGDDCKKLFEIHTTDHKGLGAHYHNWKDGAQGDALPLDSEKSKLLNDVLNEL